MCLSFTLWSLNCMKSNFPRTLIQKFSQLSILRWPGNGGNPLVESKCWIHAIAAGCLLKQTQKKDYEDQWDYAYALPRKVLFTELINMSLFFLVGCCSLMWELISNFLSINLVSDKKWWGGWCFVDEERGRLGFSSTDLPMISYSGNASHP